MTEKYKAYVSFVRRYPYCHRYWWAAVIFDHNAYLLDFYIWATVWSDDWLTRNDKR